MVPLLSLNFLSLILSIIPIPALRYFSVTVLPLPLVVMVPPEPEPELCELTVPIGPIGARTVALLVV